MNLNFEWPSDHSSEAFIVDDCNKSAFLWINSPSSLQTLIVGPRYSGKSHLSSIWCKLNNGIKLKNLDIVDLEKPILIDEIEEYEEDDLLNICNLCDRLGIPALWCTNKHPDIYSLFINDLKTRLCSLVTFEIGEPSENLFKKIMIKRCNDIGLELNQECLDYSCKHLELTYLSLNNFIIKLNFICLKKQKQPSICLINEILNTISR